MKRLILFLFMVSASRCWAQTSVLLTGAGSPPAAAGTLSPALISAYATGVDNAYHTNGTQNGVPTPSLIFNLKTNFQGGNNCAVLVFHYNSNYTISSVTDDKSETWTAGRTVSDTNKAAMALYYVLADTAGTSKITVAFTGQPPVSSPNSYLGGWVHEFKNCGTTIGPDGTLDTAATGSALTLTLGSAPSSGDLVLGFFIDTAGGPQTAPLPFDTTVDPDATFTLLSKSKAYGKLAEFNTSTTSTSVKVTYSGTSIILGLAVVIKKGSAGTGPPAGKYIDHFSADQFSTTSASMSFPCSGNTIVLIYTSNVHAATMSSISGASATWHNGPTSNTNALVQLPYGLSATCASTTTITATLGATPNAGGGTEIDMASISNAASTFDTSVVATPGTQSVAANLSTVAITPAANGEIVFGLAGITWHTPMGTAADGNSHTPIWLAAVDNKADNADSNCTVSTPGSSLDGDNALGYFLNATDHTTITFIWTGTFATGSCTTHPTGAGGWDAVALALN